MNDPFNAPTLPLGPSLLPASSAGPTREQRRAAAARWGSAASREASAGRRIALRVGEVDVRGVAPGLRAAQLRGALSAALERRLALSTKTGQARAEVRPLRSGATAAEAAESIAAAIAHALSGQTEAGR